MKKAKIAVALLLVMALAVSMASCYVISPQRMRRVQGTYKLTTYTYTPSHERKEGYTPTTYDYVNDDKYKYEDYLVITGSGTGYYAHRDASGDAYVKEVTLSYERSEDNSSLIEYVVYNDSLTAGSDSRVNRLGVTRGALNYSNISIDYTEPFTKRPMRTESLSVRWQRVDRATDLSYVTEQLGELKSYGYAAFAKRGIYAQSILSAPESQEPAENPYLYYFVVVDTARGVSTAEVCYALKASPEEQVRQTLPFSVSEAMDSITLGGEVFSADPYGNKAFSIEVDGEVKQLTLTSYSVTDSALEALVQDYQTAE